MKNCLLHSYIDKQTRSESAGASSFISNWTSRIRRASKPSFLSYWISQLAILAVVITLCTRLVHWGWYSSNHSVNVYSNQFIISFRREALRQDELLYEETESTIIRLTWRVNKLATSRSRWWRRLNETNSYNQILKKIHDIPWWHWRRLRYESQVVYSLHSTFA
jgi:hypothetical protein